MPGICFSVFLYLDSYSTLHTLFYLVIVVFLFHFTNCLWSVYFLLLFLSVCRCVLMNFLERSSTAVFECVCVSFLFFFALCVMTFFLLNKLMYFFLVSLASSYSCFLCFSCANYSSFTHGFLSSEYRCVCMNI